jgi:HEAT repeat protein
VIPTSWILAAVLASASDGDEKADARVDQALKQWVEVPTPELDLADELARIGPSAAPRLAWILEHVDDESVPRGAIAIALGRAGEGGDVASVATLRRLSAEGPEAIRVAAMTGLAEVARGDHATAFVKALDDPSERISAGAREALSTWIDLHPLTAWSSGIESSLLESRRLEAAAYLLGRLGTPAAHRNLRAMLDNWDKEVQSAALDGLHEAARVEDREAIRSILRSSDVDLRKKACLLAAGLDDVDAIPDLIDALGENDEGLVVNARWALVRLTGARLAPDPELWSRWWIGNGRPTLADGAVDRVPELVQRRALHELQNMLGAGFDEADVLVRIEERFGVGAETSHAWLGTARAELTKRAGGRRGHGSSLGGSGGGFGPAVNVGLSRFASSTAAPRPPPPATDEESSATTLLTCAALSVIVAAAVVYGLKRRRKAASDAQAKRARSAMAAASALHDAMVAPTVEEGAPHAEAVGTPAESGRASKPVSPPGLPVDTPS